MQSSCIFTKNFEETQTIYSASKPVESFTGSDTKDVIDTLSNTILQILQQAQNHQMIKEENLFLKVLNYYIIIFEK